MAEADWGGVYAARQRHSTAQYTSAPRGYHAAQPGEGGVPPAYPAAPEPAPPSPGGRLIQLTGALLSIGLVAGLGLWGYQLAMRDVTGVPVVRALEGPMRIQPDDPGGLAAAHQGLAVNEIAASGGAAGPAEQVTLAPSPLALADEDAPAHAESALIASRTAGQDAVSTPPAAAAPEPAPAPAAPEDAAPAPAALSGDAEADAVAAGLAMADALAAAANPLTGEETDLALTPEAETTLALATIPASVPGVARSPRPLPRPADIAARAEAAPLAMAVASATAAAAPAVREIPSGEIPVGTRLVQLGAFDSAEVARAAWTTLSGRFEEVLDGKDRVIEKAQSGGKTFYRLRAMGFADLSDARRFCSALMAGQAACIPVVTR